MNNRFLVLAFGSLTIIGCSGPALPIPDFAPFSELDGDLHFGDPARIVSERPGIAVNDEGQFVEYIRSTDWLYLFDPAVDSIPPKPTDRLVLIQARKNLSDTLSLWPPRPARRSARWSRSATSRSEPRRSAPDCRRTAEWWGRPSSSAG